MRVLVVEANLVAAQAVAAGLHDQGIPGSKFANPAFLRIPKWIF
jgi:hypothetical protein